MEKIYFADGEEICRYDGGAVTRQRSKFIENYKRNTLNVERAKNWKHSGEGARFRGDERPGEDGVSFQASINGIYPTEGDETVYSFNINGTSGIYKTVIGDEKSPETHIVSTSDGEFYGGCIDAKSNVLVCSLRRNCYNSDLVVFDVKTGEYKIVTDGDTLDEDPFVSPENRNEIYFTSRGAGRDRQGNFVRYSNSVICKLDLAALTVREVAADDKYNYMKPVFYGGKLYAIIAPSVQKRTNPLVEILLIPFRIVQAIANFLNFFVTAFTGKSLASGGSNPAKGREYDGRKEYIKGNLIDYDKELKRNASKKDKDYGFIPASWKLAEVGSGEIIASGVADYDITSDGIFIISNGRRVFAVKDGKKTKLCNAENCLTVACMHQSQTPDFSF